MNKQIEALKMAIKLMEEENLDLTDAYQVCKEALEQEQSFAEKTAQMSFMSLWDAYTTLKMKLEALEQPAQEPVPLIRHENGNFSPAPSWQGLSDDEIHNYADHNFAFASEHFDEIFNFARAIEQALKEKNYD